MQPSTFVSDCFHRTSFIITYVVLKKYAFDL